MTKNQIIKTVEKEYPELIKDFKEIQKEQYETFCLKHYDYGEGNIAMGTSAQEKDDIKLILTGLIVRLNDKINRLINLVIKRGTDDAANEPVIDTFKDLSVYGIIAQIVNNKKWKKG